MGNLDAVKDWGYAGDYAYGMYLMLQYKHPEDFILSTNMLHTIQDFVMECAKQLEISDWRKHIEIDSKIVMRNISTILKGDCSKAEEKLRWVKTKSFQELVAEMISDGKKLC